MDRKQRAEALRGREVRRRYDLTPLEMRAAEDGTVSVAGYASTTGRAYDMGWYQETIARGAFGTTLSQKPDVQLLLNHEGLPLARTTNGSLDLREDERGLLFEARMDGSDPDVQRIQRKIESGLLDQCSFAFRVTRQTWDEEYENREITEVDLNRGDVSIVNYGANPNTSVSLRSLLSDLGDDLTDEEVAQLREDPAVMTLVRRLAPPVETPAPPQISLDTYKAIAYALRSATK